MDAIEIAEGLARLGKSPAACAAIVEGVNNQPASKEPVRALRRSLEEIGAACASDALERTLLRHAMEAYEPRIGQAPVHGGVKPLIRKEFARFASAPGP